MHNKQTDRPLAWYPSPEPARFRERRALHLNPLNPRWPGTRWRRSRRSLCTTAGFAPKRGGRWFKSGRPPRPARVHVRRHALFFHDGLEASADGIQRGRDHCEHRGSVTSYLVCSAFALDWPWHPRLHRGGVSLFLFTILYGA